MSSSERNLPHIKLSNEPIVEGFLLSRGGDEKPKSRTVADRPAHGSRLVIDYELATQNEREEDDSRNGTVVTFASFPGHDLAIQSLDPRSSGERPVLMSATSDGAIEYANVWIPDSQKGYFLSKLQDYLTTATQDKPKNVNLVEGIQSIKTATIRQLWTDDQSLFPNDSSATLWWEVWLRKNSDNEPKTFEEHATAHGIKVQARYLGFIDRYVVLALGTVDQLSALYESIDEIAELRKPSEIVGFIVGLSPTEQQEWVDDLLLRTSFADHNAPSVTLLDTGVQQNHPLLTDSLSPSDVHVVDATWQSRPICGHGTEMAGLALYGDLSGALVSKLPVRIAHRLESVKILPDVGENDPSLYGLVIAQAIDRPEIERPDRRRVFMLATTARIDQSIPEKRSSELRLGQPTSWSSTMDLLAFGTDFETAKTGEVLFDRSGKKTPRLLIVSAGNIRDLDPTWENYLDKCDLSPIEDPAQAWNAITVGAYSESDSMAGADTDFANYKPLAPRGELSPTSRTSVLVETSVWPFKPEVVADGGNWLVSSDKSSVDPLVTSGRLTTKMHTLGTGQLTTSFDTSAATAQVAEIAAGVMAEYPDLKPETVRALVVHSAEWTEPMRAYFDPTNNKKTKLRTMLRRYGMGVPDKTRALRSASNALTLLVEGRIHPFQQKKDSNDAWIRGWNVHTLPWPVEVLQDLGEADARLRITLSYFIEPNPSRRGWRGRYTYASHGLRFAVQRPDETVNAFRARINKKARTDGNAATHSGGGDGWLFGTDHQQAPGSIHTDIWSGYAAQLAGRRTIGIYPVGGWWKERAKLDDSDRGVDYALVVSIETPKVETDLWTPVYEQVISQTEIET